MSAPRTWQMNVYLEGPLYAEILEAGDNPREMPKKMNLKRTIIDENFYLTVSDDIIFFLTPFVREGEWTTIKKGAPVRAVREIESTNQPNELLRSHEVYIEELIDYLSYLWSHPVGVYKVEIIDVTAPIAEGEIRDFLLAGDYKSPKLRSGIIPEDQFLLKDLKNYSDLDQKTRTALRWYSLALQPQSIAQQFMALWIALELIVNDKLKATLVPYKAPCEHLIENCPTCGKPTNRRIGGAQIKKFLVSSMLIDPNDVQNLWRTRQISHGNNKMRSEDIEKIDAAALILLRIVRRLLGNRIATGYQEQNVDFPWPRYSMLEGTRRIGAQDIDEPVRTSPPTVGPLLRIVM